MDFRRTISLLHRADDAERAAAARVLDGVDFTDIPTVEAFLAALEGRPLGHEAEALSRLVRVLADEAVRAKILPVILSKCGESETSSLLYWVAESAYPERTVAIRVRAEIGGFRSALMLLEDKRKPSDVRSAAAAALERFDEPEVKRALDEFRSESQVTDQEGSTYNVPSMTELTMKMKLRNQPATLSDDAVKAMLRQCGLYCKNYGPRGAFGSPEGEGIAHQYERGSDGQVILDHTTGLMWQQGGSTDMASHSNATIYVGKLILDGFAGHNDWRFPTLEEAMSLMEMEAKNANVSIDPAFDKTQWRIWTCDRTTPWDCAWVVDFFHGYCHKDSFYNDFYVRAVRSL